MKKLYYPLFALATLAMTSTSCSDELNNGTSADSNEATVSFKVQLENAVGSRAIGDGTNAKYLAFAVYKEAVNDTIDNEVEALRQDNIEVDSETLTATVTTRLVKGQSYNFIFWAQNEKTNTGTKEAPVNKGTYYDVKDLRDIEVLYGTNNSIAANDEKRDAFYAVKKELKITGPINETITLKRPFAQVNVGTKIGSLAEAATAETTITKSKMVIKGVASKLHPYSGKVSEAKDVTYTLANIPESNHTDLVGDLKDVKDVDYEYLSMNYILVNDQDPGTTNKIDGTKKGLVNATFEVWEANATKAVNTFEIPNVPVQRNWRTNIIGDILSENVTFNIVIDPKFDTDENGEDHNYELAKELAYAFANGGEVTLENKEYELGQAMTLTGGKNVVLNLNGASIKTKDGADAFVVNDGTLTIKGEGSITTEDKTAGYAVIVDGAKAVVNIYGGTYTIGLDDVAVHGTIACNSAVYTKNGGVANIYGGTYKVSTTQTTDPVSKTRFLLNRNGKAATAGGPITVYGGKFEEFNPANNVAEGVGTNFVATGYEAVNTGTTAVPVYEVVVAPKADTNGNMALADNGVVMNSISITDGGALDGKGHTLTVADTPATNLLVKGTGDATVKNLTIKGNGEYYDTNKSTRALYFDGTMGDIIISNVHVSGVGYALNVNSSNGSGKLNVSNSTLVGWSSFAAVFTEAKFTNVHFGIGTYFDANSMFNGGIRPYMTTVFENCTFEAGYTISCTEIGASESLTFKNCKVGNTVIDKTNIWDLLKKEGNPDANSIKF